MWRTPRRRAASARARLALARDLWGWRPHAAQRRLFAGPAPFRVAACGRRWGKTEVLAVDIATLALAEAAAGRPCRQLVVAPTDAQARLIGAAVQSRLDAAFDAPAPATAGLSLAARRRPGLGLTITGAAGASEVLFRTAGRDGRGLRGLSAHRIVVDEAAYVPDAVLTEVLLPMLTDVGGELLLASSPAGRRGAFFRLFCRGEAQAKDTPPAPGGPHPAPGGPHPPAPSPKNGRGGDGGDLSEPSALSEPSPVLGRGQGEGRRRQGEGLQGGGALTYAAFQCPSADNPHLDKAYLAAMAEELGETSYAAEYGAQFVDDGGAVFRADDIDACLAADDAVRLDGGDLVSAPVPGHWYSVGVDWGRKLDFTVVAVLDATARPARLVGLWRWQGMGWEAQAARVGDLVASFLPLRVLADGNSIGDPVAEQLQKFVCDRLTGGERVPQIERFLFGAESKTRLVDRLTFALSARSLTYPPHRALLSELRAFEYGAVGASGRPRMAARGGGHDDTVMALALAWYGAPDGPPAPPSSLLLLGSSLGTGRRG